MARPRSDDPKERVTVFVRRSTLEFVDELRGTTPRGQFISDLVETAVSLRRAFGSAPPTYKRPDPRRSF